MINPFQFEAPATQIQFGVGVAAQLGAQAQALGIRRALLVTDAVNARQTAGCAALESLAAAGIGAHVYW